MTEKLKLKNQLCFPLYAASRKITAAYRPLLKPLGLTYTQYLVMLVLWEKDGQTVGDICRLLHLDNGTLTPVIRKMAGNALLKRERIERDERVVRIFLTEKGKNLQKEALDIPDKMMCQVKLSKEEVGALYQMLYKIIDHSF